MARLTVFTAENLSSLIMFANDRTIHDIKVALSNGDKVEVLESEFGDDTDFCKILINGKCVLTIDGY